jgi:hypothetical protein
MSEDTERKAPNSKYILCDMEGIKAAYKTIWQTAIMRLHPT